MKRRYIRILAAALLCIPFLLTGFPSAAEEPGEAIYIFGGESNPNRAKIRTMGDRGWYYMYSLQTNAGENIDLASFKECLQTETGLFKPAEPALIPSLDPAQPDTMAEYKGDWFAIRRDGFLAGDTGFSAALKWVCETDGIYDIQVSYSGGSSNGYAAEAFYSEPGGHYVPASDGVFMSFWIKGDLVFCEDSWLGEGHRLAQTELAYNGVELRAGDEIYLVSDTKVNGGWDDPWWYLNISRTGGLPD